MSDAENPIKASDPIAKITSSTVPDAEAFSRTVDVSGPQPEGTAEPRLLEGGEKLGKYEIQKKLGQGGMGTVYLAFDPMIEREVAIKVLPPNIANQPRALARFLSEARATGKLNHPNVVAIYDIAQEGELHYIVMELVRGGSGAEFIASRVAVDWKFACQVAADACEGLAAAHAAGLVHRDIKPENLMLTDEGAVKVVDFGLSKLIDAANESQLGITGAGQIVGTPHYMSPEQFQGKSVDARSDVYSMGATFYFLLIGQPPFADATNMVRLMTSHLQKPPPDPSALNRQIPTSCRDIVYRAMAKDPDQRYRDAGEFAAALREVLSGAADTGREPTTYHPLESVVVVEPSKMQAMMLQSALKNAGASTIALCGSAAEAERRCQSEPPDLLITAMQLSDGKGIELIRRLREDPQQRDTVLLLNSNDSSIEELIKVGQTGPLAVVSKKTKPDEFLRALHGCTFLDIPKLSAPIEVDATTLRFGLVCDASRIPDPMASLIRRANLLDVQVTTFDDLAAGKGLSGTVDLLIVLRTAGDAAQDSWLYADLLAHVKRDAQVLAAVQVDGERITLRAVQRGSFTTVARCQLDDDRLLRMVQLCRLP